MDVSLQSFHSLCSKPRQKVNKNQVLFENKNQYFQQWKNQSQVFQTHRKQKRKGDNYYNKSNKEG